MEIALTLSNIADMIIIFSFCCVVGYGLGTLLGNLAWLVYRLIRKVDFVNIHITHSLVDFVNQCFNDPN